jgi:phage terminase large subunit-like protein
MGVSRSELARIVVAVDPAVTANEDSDDSGVMVVARGPHQDQTCAMASCPGHGYVLADRTCHLIPAELSKLIVETYDDWQADRIIGEVNNGGDYIGALIHAVRPGVPYATVRATRGKQTRAEPVSALYEQGRVHHLGVFAELEQELETWTPDAKWSPNRLDALVWGLTFLGLIGGMGSLHVPQGEIPRTAQAATGGDRAVASLPPHLRRLHRRQFTR